MVLLKEKEDLCREMHDVNGLAFALIKQGEIAVDLPKHRTEAVSLLREALSLAEKHGLREIEEAATSLLGDPAMTDHCQSPTVRANLQQILDRFNRGDIHGAIEKLRELRRALHGNQLREIGILANNLFAVHDAHSDPESGLALLDQEESIRRELQDWPGLARCLYNRTLCLTAPRLIDGGKVQIETPAQTAIESHRLARKYDSKETLHAAEKWLSEYVGRLLGLAQHTWKSDNLGMAIRLQELSVTILRELAHSHDLATALATLAMMLGDADKFQTAVTCVREAEQIFKNSDERQSLLHCLEVHSDVCYRGGEPDEAFRLSQQQERIAKGIGDGGSLVAALYRQAVILACDRDQPVEALVAAREAHRLAVEQRDNRMVKVTSEFMSAITDGKTGPRS